MKPTIVEQFADNGGHSHWSVIDSSAGAIIIDNLSAAVKTHMFYITIMDVLEKTSSAK